MKYMYYSTVHLATLDVLVSPVAFTRLCRKRVKILV